jgi:amphi-Trp domain-containing protein
MSDVKVERKEAISRDEAAQLLSLLSKAFASGDHAEIPFGPSVVSLHIPDRVRTEVEVEIDGDEVEVEVEFKWSMAEHETSLAMEDMAASPARARQGNGARKSTRSARGQGH